MKILSLCMTDKICSFSILCKRHDYGLGKAKPENNHRYG